MCSVVNLPTHRCMLYSLKQYLLIWVNKQCTTYPNQVYFCLLKCSIIQIHTIMHIYNTHSSQTTHATWLLKLTVIWITLLINIPTSKYVPVLYYYGKYGTRNTYYEFHCPYLTGYACPRTRSIIDFNHYIEEQLSGWITYFTRG